MPGPENKTIEALLRRAYGGTDAAVVPDTWEDTGLPEGPAAPGIAAAFAQLRDRLSDAGGRPLWVFLVGGPGNGKSYEATRLLRHLGHEPSKTASGALAQRNYDVPAPHGAMVRIVNDATIRSSLSTEEPGELAKDVRSAASPRKVPLHLVVNVNRGILVDESLSLLGNEGWTAELALVRWLMSGASDDARCIQDSRVGEFTQECTFRHAEFVADVCAVFLDHVSLLEMAPEPLVAPERGWSAYRVMKMDAARTGTPAGKLLADVVLANRFEDACCNGCEAQDICPFLANARTLRSRPGSEGFLRMLRGAEIAGGRLLTYRELWSLFAVAIAGPLRTGRRMHPCEAVRAMALRANTGEHNALAELRAHRLYESLWPCDTGGAISGNGTAPAIVLMQRVDPVVDVSSAWARPVNEAMEGIQFERAAGEALRGHSGEFAQCWSDLDARADNHDWSHGLQGLDDVQARALKRRRGESLYRLFAIAAGRPAYMDVLKEWVELRRSAKPEGGDPPVRPITKGLTRILFPACGIGHVREDCLLPVFRARTEPLVGTPEKEVLCGVVPGTGNDAPRIKLRAKGDSLWLELHAAGSHRADLQLDHALCREALVAHDGGGFTEEGAVSIPRLERTRASFLSEASAPRLVLAGSDAAEVSHGR